jgi:hypothetical protein
MKEIINNKEKLMKYRLKAQLKDSMTQQTVSLKR